MSKVEISTDLKLAYSSLVLILNRKDAKKYYAFDTNFNR